MAKRRKPKRRKVPRPAPTAPPPKALESAQPETSERGSGWLPKLALPLEIDERFRSPALWLGVFGLGFLLRFLHLVGLKRSPLFTSLQLDAEYYDAWAREIAAGAWIGKAAFWVDPLYAYLLGSIYKLFGHELILPRLLNVALGLGTAFLVSRIARRVWGSQIAAITAAALSLLFIPAIHFEGQPEKTALTVFLLALSLHLFLIGRERALIGAGVAIGCSVLARGNALILMPFAVLALALGWDRKQGAQTARRERLRRASLLLAGALPLIALSTAHNYLASREFVPTTTNIGINLYLGNHAGNDRGYYTPPPFLHPSTANEVPDFRAEAERQTGEPLSDAALSRYWTKQSVRAIVEAPGLFVTRILTKLELALHNDEVPDSDAPELVAQWSWVLRSPVVWFGQLLPLVALGAAIGWRRRKVRIVAAVALSYLVSLLPFFVMARLRVQLLPMAAVLAAGGASWLAAAIRERDKLALRNALLVVVPVTILCFYRPSWMADRRETSLAVGWNNLGAALLKMGKTDEAVQAYERAIAQRDDAVPAALRSLSQIYVERGDEKRAEQLLRRLVELRPDSRSAREQLRKLTAQGEPQTPAAMMKRARSLSNEGKPDQAVALLQQAVRTGPYDEGLHYYLGELMERHSTAQAMIDFFSSEVGRDQKPQTSHYFLAVGLLRAENPDGAIAELERALEIDPAHEMSQHKWGLILESRGDLQGAFEHLLEATKIHPDFRAAFEDAARVAERLGKTDEATSLRDRAKKADPNSLRRYLHWARYLHEHGKNLAAYAEVQRMLAERPDDPEARALRDKLREALERAGIPIPEPAAPTKGPTAANPDTWRLSAEARDAFKDKLGLVATGSPTWIAYDGRSAEAKGLAEELAAAFREAGWRVERMTVANIALKAGIHVFAANEPSQPCGVVADAMTAAGFSPTFGSGYRAFVESKRQENPNFVGLEFLPDQDCVLAVGRKPGS